MELSEPITQTCNDDRSEFGRTTSTISALPLVRGTLPRPGTFPAASSRARLPSKRVLNSLFRRPEDVAPGRSRALLGRLMEPQDILNRRVTKRGKETERDLPCFLKSLMHLPTKRGRGEEEEEEEEETGFMCNRRRTRRLAAIAN